MNFRRMVLALGGIGASLIIGGLGNEPTEATYFMDTNVPVAGISVTLDNFFENNADAEDAIKTYLGIGVKKTVAETEAATVAETVPETEAETETVAETEPETEKASPYANIAVSQVGADDGYVNVRDAASTEGEILGKIYNNCAATILESVEGEGGTWYHISSGSVTGYIKAEYFVTGDEAEQLAIKIGKIFGKVTAGGLRLRTEPNTESEIITKLWEGEVYTVVEQAEGFVKISLGQDDDGTAIEGYVSEDYIDVYVSFDEAISREEEEAKIAEEERRAREAREAEERLAAAQAAAQQQAQQQAPAQKPQQQAPVQAPSNVSTATRDAIVAYALQFVGNPYVYGGTSLTNGTDCSGFTKGVMAKFGIGLSRTSRSQANQGRAISFSEARPGDLLFYGRGSSIGHVALYIGNGQIVHASDETTGIIVSNCYYRDIIKCVNVIGD